MNSGIMTQAPSSLRNEPSGRKGASAEWMKEQQSHKWMVDFHDRMADGKTAFDKIMVIKLTDHQFFSEHFVEYIPITAKDKSIIYQFRQYVLRAEWGWSGDLMIADYEDLQESEASEIFVNIISRISVCKTEPQDFLVAQDHHRRRRGYSSSPLVENSLIDILKNLVSSFTTQIMRHSRSHWNTPTR